MDRIFAPCLGPTDWRRLLADPQRHWRPGKSALESAVAWEAARGSARGLPEKIAQAIDSHSRTAGGELLLAVPELRVELPGGGHASQNDVWALLRTGNALSSLSVEAKSGESLGELVREWLPKSDDPAPSRKPERLDFLRACLGLAGVDLADLRYQLLHRAASAILMGERFRASTAILLVHSFGGADDDKSRDDYRRFAEAMLSTPTSDSLTTVGRPTRVTLLIGWVTDRPASLDILRRAI